MSTTTAISWCDRTWSPWEGCTKVSPGCDHCYAARRNAWIHRGENWGPGAPRRLTIDWRKPVRWNEEAAKAGKRLTVFPSICDPFDNEVPQHWRTRFFALIHDTPHLTWILLTKRIGNAAAMLREDVPEGISIVDRIWLGATFVNQPEVDRDYGKLLAIDARVRFVSIEPMLGPVDIIHAERVARDACPSGKLHGRRIHWVIAGGESGPGARPAHPEWFRSLRDQCAAAGVPFHFKQWGEWANPAQTAHETDRVLREAWLRSDGTVATGDVSFFGGDEAVYRYGKAAAGRLLDGIEHNAFPA